jgi:hypothetical protein
LPGALRLIHLLVSWPYNCVTKTVAHYMQLVKDGTTFFFYLNLNLSDVAFKLLPEEDSVLST